ncbi:hypothetical protein FOA43_001231 [Brettanomyces nanus]|uniref:Large ribosomal subunit protein bL28m n=1 Tax=Eeniella nana TaxID=13502 RepID=A0A875RXU7_EENNA|nr:uncharacterized protein FOA43_001231 [Brettanomyces nanus]QPG73916.1 hypothetical protein FOA43_001231 [Brettanomyces nanus]
MGSLSKFSQCVKPFTRLFSTTQIGCERKYDRVMRRHVKKIVEYKEGDIKPWYLRIPKEASKYPPYPYGEATLFKRSDRGLYGGQQRGKGFQVSEMGNKTPRPWLPNVISKTLWSEALNHGIKMKLTARVLRTITKEGGLDNYVTKDKAARVKELGLFGWRLRYNILKARQVANQPPNYEVVKTAEGKDVKVFYRGNYKGEPIKLTVGRRKLLTKLFPKVKLNTPEVMKFAQFSIDHAETPFADILRECEANDVDLDDVKL